MEIRYVEGDSRIHRMHPVIKGWLLLLLAAASLIYQAVILLALAGVLLLIAATSGIGSRRILSILKPVPLFVLIIVAANVFLVRNSEPYSAGIIRGLEQGARVLLLILSAGLFFMVTDPARFSDSVISLGFPFRAFGLEKEDISLILMIIFSFMPYMKEEVARIRRARMVRCGRGGYLSVRRKGVLPVILPLTASVLRRAEELDLALEARNYGAGGPGRGERIRGSDLLAGFICLVIFLLGLYAKY